MAPKVSLFLKWCGAELEAGVCQAASPCQLYLAEIFFISLILGNVVNFDDNAFSFSFFFSSEPHPANSQNVLQRLIAVINFFNFYFPLDA